MRIERVTDASDPRLADYRDLTDVALRRVSEPAEGLYIAESAKVLARALAAGHTARTVLTHERWLGEVIELVGDRDVPVLLADAALTETLTGYAVHRGMLAAMHRPVLPTLEKMLPSVRRALVLEDIVDHTNVGAAFRAAAGLGADAVFVSERCADPLYRRSVRVSMGTVFQVPWTRLPSWGTAKAAFASAGIELAALALTDDAVALDDYARSAPDRVALVMGTEGDGLSRRALSVADRVVTIPMAGGVDSLNVAAAASVALWALRV